MAALTRQWWLALVPLALALAVAPGCSSGGNNNGDDQNAGVWDSAIWDTDTWGA